MRVGRPKHKITSTGSLDDQPRFGERVNDGKDESGAAQYEVDDLGPSYQALSRRHALGVQRWTIQEKGIKPTHKRKASSEDARNDAKRVELGMHDAEEDNTSNQDISFENPLGLEIEYDMLASSFDKLFVSEEGKEKGMQTRKEVELEKQAALERISPTKKVLETAELLEKILSYLPPGKILRVLSVCKMWKACYYGSQTQLQTKTFYRPSGVYLPVPNSNQIYAQNNELVSKDWGPTPTSRFPGVPAGQTYVGLLLPQGVAKMDMLLRSRDQRFPNYNEIRIVFEKSDTWRTKHTQSWRHLLAIDPPYPTLITVEYTDHEDYAAESIQREVKAYVPVLGCALGIMVLIAQGLNAALETKYFRKVSSGMFGLDPKIVAEYYRICTTQPARWEVTETVTVKKRLG